MKCDDPEINASLYNNRAAAHYHLKNYRSALFDSERALAYKPDYTKARLRAAKSALSASKFDKCIEHCEKLLQSQSKDKEVIDLLNIAKKRKTIQERDERKKIRTEAKKSEQKEAVIKALLDRGIKISDCEDADDIDLSKLEPCIPGAENAIVSLEDGVLKWPVLLLYPEYQTTDFLKECPENVPLLNQVQQIFPAPWDVKNKYSVDTINLYYEGWDNFPHKVDPTKNLGDILKEKHYVLKSGTPSFFCLPKGTQMEKSYLEAYL